MGLIRTLLQNRAERALAYEVEANRRLRRRVNDLLLDCVRMRRELEIALRENAALRQEQGK